MTAAGWTIIILLLLTVLALIGIVKVSFWLLDEFNWFFHTDGNLAGKVLLFLPWVVLKIWCAVIIVIVAICTLGAGISVANDVRKWWHKGH